MFEKRERPSFGIAEEKESQAFVEPLPKPFDLRPMPHVPRVHDAANAALLEIVWSDRLERDPDVVSACHGGHPFVVKHPPEDRG